MHRNTGFPNVEIGLNVHNVMKPSFLIIFDGTCMDHTRIDVECASYVGSDRELNGAVGDTFQIEGLSKVHKKRQVRLNVLSQPSLGAISKKCLT